MASEANSARVETPSLAKMCDRWTFTVPRVMNMRAPISGLVRPSAAKRTTSCSQTQTLQEGRRFIELALRAERNCYEGCVKANAETKKFWNQAFVEEVIARERQIVNVTWAEPFRTLLTARRGVSDKRLLVEVNGFEPSTSELRTQPGVP